MIRFRGTVHRAHDPKWSFDPISGEGAARFGQRFNRQGCPALYTSLDIKTAFDEVRQGGLLKPTVAVAYTVDCADVLDLTTAAQRKAAAVTLSEMACDWEAFRSNGQIPPSWDMADRLIARGVAGILVPSFAANAHGANLVLWRFGPDPPHQIVPYDPDGRLPRDQASWSTD